MIDKYDTETQELDFSDEEEVNWDICSNCGHESEEDSIFCEECGTRLREDEDDGNEHF